MFEEELRGAAARGNLDLVKELLKQGAVFAPDSSGRTPLHLSCAAGHLEIVKLLINPKNINSVDSVGRTPLQIAASCGHVPVVDILLKNGANVNSRDTQNGNTALHEASWLGLSQTLSLIAKDNNELDLPNNSGFAPIHLACQNGHNQSCRELLLAGANPNAQNNYGDAALHTSARYGHAGVARILLSAGSKPSLQNKNGDTALHISAAMGRRKLTNIFLEAGCDKSLKNKQFETARDIAMRKGHIEIINILDKSSKSKSHKHNNNKKSSETSDSDKRSKDHSRKSGHSGEDKDLKDGEVPGWSPYGCHYYPDLSLFPQPNLDSLPCEPLGKGEQYFLDLSGNICKGPVGVGLTCHCRNFVLDMESRLERHSAEVRAKLRLARAKLEHRVNKTEGILNQYISNGCKESNGRHRSSKRSIHRSNQRSRSLDLLSNDDLPRKLKNTHLDVENNKKCKNSLIKSSDSEEVRSSDAKATAKGVKHSDEENKIKTQIHSSKEIKVNVHNIIPAPRKCHLSVLTDKPSSQSIKNNILVEPVPRAIQTTIPSVEPLPRKTISKEPSVHIVEVTPHSINCPSPSNDPIISSIKTVLSNKPSLSSTEATFTPESIPLSSNQITNSSDISPASSNESINTSVPKVQSIELEPNEPPSCKNQSISTITQPTLNSSQSIIHACQPIAHSTQQIIVKRDNQNAIQTFSVQV